MSGILLNTLHILFNSTLTIPSEIDVTIFFLLQIKDVRLESLNKLPRYTQLVSGEFQPQSLESSTHIYNYQVIQYFNI